MYKFTFSRYDVLPLPADADDTRKRRYEGGVYEYDDQDRNYSVTVVDNDYESALLRANALGPVREQTELDSVTELTIDGEEVE